MTREAFEFEACIPVEDFLAEDMANEDWSDARDEAFEMARDDTYSAKDDMASSLEDFEFEITAIHFREFDSGNISHANAYYAVVVQMERADAEKFVKDYYGSDTDVTEFFHNPEPKLI